MQAGGHAADIETLLHSMCESSTTGFLWTLEFLHALLCMHARNCAQRLVEVLSSTASD